MEVESYDGEVEMLESYESGLAALTSSTDFPMMEVQQAVTQHLAIMPNPGKILMGFLLSMVWEDARRDFSSLILELAGV